MKTDTITRRRGRSKAGAIWGLLLLLALPLASRPATAEERKALAPEKQRRAKGHFQAGAALYAAGEFEGAHAQFEKAYQISGLPDLLFNLAKTAEKLDRPAEAIGYLERYLADKPEAADRPAVEAQIARLRQVEAERAPPPQEAPPPAQLPTPAPAVSAPVAQPAGSPREDGPGRPPWPALTLLASGAVVLTVGIGLGIGAMSTAKQAAAADRFDPALDSRGRALNTGAITLDVLGAAALAAGAVWTGVHYIRGRRQPATAMLPARAGAPALLRYQP